MDPPISTPPSPFDSAIILELPEFLAESTGPARPPPETTKPKQAPQPAELDPDEILEKYIGKIGGKPRKAPVSTIEDRIMRRSREAKSRFAARKKEIEADQMKELKPTPTINPQSRKIAEQNFLTRYFPEKIQSIAMYGKTPKGSTVAVTSGGAEKEFQTQTFQSPKPNSPSFLTSVHRADYHEERQLSAEREKRETFVMVPRCHVSLPLGSSTHVYLPIRLGPEDKCKLYSPKAELSAFAMLRKIKEEEAKPKPTDPLEMTAKDRSRYFTEMKERKLQAEQEKKHQEEARECTFTPSISRLSLARMSNTQGSISGGPSVSLTDRSKSSQVSYTDRYQKKQDLMRSSASSSTKKFPKDKSPPTAEMFRVDTNVRVPPPNNMYAPVVSRAHPNPPREDIASPFYAQLSPKAQLLGFRSGCDFDALEDKIKASRG